MRRIGITSLVLLALAALSLTATNAIAAKAKQLHVVESEGGPVEPGSEIRIAPYGTTTFVTPAGYIECAPQEEGPPHGAARMKRRDRPARSRPAERELQRRTARPYSRFSRISFAREYCSDGTTR
jgi:hypothetical protein